MNDHAPSRRWFHFIETTYSSWLHGDIRGFRTRHHREHVAGDYTRPPPLARYASRRSRNQKSLAQPPVILAPAWRPIIGIALRERLEQLGALVLCVAVSGQHAHVLAKVPLPSNSRDLMGLAKKHSYFEARSRGWKGKLWARRGKEIPVRERAHQLNVYRYILRHAEQGAWVWDLMQAGTHGPQSVGLE